MTPKSEPKSEPDVGAMQQLLALRSQLSRAEKEARKSQKTAISTAAPRPLSPKREAELQGVSTDSYLLSRAHSRLREAVLSGRYQVCAHVVQHARAQGFLEHDVMDVLTTGRVRAVYPEDRRWLVAGYFGAGQIRLPLQVVVELQSVHTPFGYEEYLDIVTAFVPKNPHQLLSRSRLAVMLRYDSQQVQHRLSSVGNKVGNRARGRWKRGA